MFLQAIDRFFRHEALGGVLLMLSAVAAMVVANSSLEPFYSYAMNAPLVITIDGTGLEKPVLLWINDGLMAVFFFLIGLELKREFVEGKLKNPRDVVLPGAAALGGMAIPALVFIVLNWQSPQTMRGWAIPAATDIAFALGVLALLGQRAPPALKVFLLTLAILDDLGAILIIALFYTAELNLFYLGMAVLPLLGLVGLNIRGTHRVGPALLLGAIMWFFVLKSGVHATLAGVMVAFLIPNRDRLKKSPLHGLEHGLSPYVLYLIVPIFAFANAGVSLVGLQVSDLLSPLPLGITLGLVVGKQVGVFGMTWLVVRAGYVHLPHGVGWAHIYGVSCLAGIGFTMSLFIGGLSFDSPELLNQVRLGVLLGSLVSGLIGYGVLRWLSGPAPAGTTARV
ncbi:MAG: Na+/H+ antiporter NhaA [Rhodobacteraceae bacterium]|nr:Na+/H+ antiporter NhaA [Paracoccaceae bacterium]